MKEFLNNIRELTEIESPSGREGAVSKVASLMYLTPGVTALMALMLFDETLNFFQVVGLVLAGIGVAASTARKGGMTAIKNRIFPS